MLKKTISYTDFAGNEREEDFYFNLSRTEVVKLQLSVDGGYAEKLTQVSKANKPREIIAYFEDLVKVSYGVRSDDGRRFIKSEEVFNDFKDTEAYSQLFIELLTDADAAAAFVRGVMPQDLVEAANAQIEEDQAGPQDYQQPVAQAPQPRTVTPEQQEIQGQYQPSVREQFGNGPQDGSAPQHPWGR